MDHISSLFGANARAHDFTVLQVCMRAILIFFATLVMVRVGNKRFFAKKTAFDLILSLILASMMARTINGEQPLVPTISAGFLLVWLHRLLALMACRWPAFGTLIKGSEETLISDGEVRHEVLRKHHLGMDDLREELRLNGVQEPKEVQVARLERSGEVSVIRTTSGG